ncbi:MAG: FkbM family methyltransferase [Bosea sp.]|jgi:FkbM family methyltransferase|nr:FkbM family methyltransferase [Bosea sp. (in: a-proteobacteria)]
MQGSLENLAAVGFAPRTVLDVGAHEGHWASMASKAFPDAAFHLFEAQPTQKPALNAALAKTGNGGSVNIALLGPDNRDNVVFHVMGTGSSVLPEVTPFDRTQVALPMRRMDDVVAGLALTGPLLIKLDTQGFELEILKGATKTLGLAEVVILEVSLLTYNEGAPLFHEVVGFMAAAGFLAYDVCGMERRRTDHVLFQCDMIFVRHDSELRARRKFFAREPERGPNNPTS